MPCESFVTFYISNIYLLQGASHRFVRPGSDTRTFHEPNIVHRIKYRKISASETIGDAFFDLEPASAALPAWPGRVFAFGANLEPRL